MKLKYNWIHEQVIIPFEILVLGVVPVGISIGHVRLLSSEQRASLYTYDRSVIFHSFGPGGCDHEHLSFRAGHMQ